jgi:PAS domain-containing protein
MVSDGSDDYQVHETLLPSLSLSVLGGLSATDEGHTPVEETPELPTPAPVQPTPAHESGPQSDASGSGPAVNIDSPARRPRGARRGDTIGERYVVEGQIGRGGMGRVLRVRHTVLGKPFALKLIKVPIATNPRIREMFYREARLASALSHDNICSIVDFGEDPHFGLFMVMELLEGETLHNKIRHTGRLAPKVACDVIKQIAEALRYIHGRAIIHGDIKSENILLIRTPDRRRVVKLLDFGLARPDAATHTKNVEGTPEYLSPERIRGAPASQASDIYALGILFYEILVGQLPYRGNLEEVFKAHCEQTVPKASEQIDEALDERADEIIGRATSHDPDDRHPDVAGFLYELRTLMNMLGIDVGRGGLGRAATAKEGKPAKARRATPNRQAMASAEVFDAAPVPLACCDASGNVRVANRAFLEFLGVAGKAAGINLRDSGFCEVYPALMDDLSVVVSRRKTVKRIIYLSEGGGIVVEVAVILTPAEKSQPITAGEVHLTLHPLTRHAPDELA